MSPRLRADRRVGLLLAAVVLLVLVAVGATVALPATDGALRERTDEGRSLSELEREGATVYQSEGCWYCHTQQSRATRTDAPYGAPLAPGDHPDLSPAMLGQVRFGPDLTRVGSRTDADALRRVLLDPRADDRWSSMPAYGYLSERELEALTAYLLSLR